MTGPERQARDAQIIRSLTRETREAIGRLYHGHCPVCAAGRTRADHIAEISARAAADYVPNAPVSGAKADAIAEANALFRPGVYVG